MKMEKTSTLILQKVKPIWRLSNSIYLSKKSLIAVFMFFSMLTFWSYSHAQVNQSKQPVKNKKANSGLFSNLKQRVDSRDENENEETDNPGKYLEFEFKRTKDPALGTVPT